MFTPEFIAAEVAYRTELLTADFRGASRPKGRLRAALRLPVLRRRQQQVRLRSLASR